MEKNVSTGLKVWLWIVIVLNVLGAIGNIGSIGSSALSAIIGLVVEAIMIYSCVLIMFQTKKLGFKLMCVAAVINLINSIVAIVAVGVIAGAATGSATVGIASGAIGIVSVIIGACICPLITYLFMRKDWDMFE